MTVAAPPDESTRLRWRTDRFVELDGHRIPIAPEVEARPPGWAGLRRQSRRTVAWKRLVWPLYHALLDATGDGFIEWEVGRLLKRHWRPGATYLEIACGALSLERFVPPGSWFNAFDIGLSEFHLRWTLARSRRVNAALADVERIPLPDACADVLVLTQAFGNFRNLDTALREIRRVAKPGARFICTVSNHHAWLYRSRTWKPRRPLPWRFAEFPEFMAERGFRFVEGHMKGFGIPAPRWLVPHILTIPVTMPREDLNIVFFYVFEVDAAP
ncbi:MAG TPA: methyltransferase domain-containing protein [Azospirillum sp.]